MSKQNLTILFDANPMVNGKKTGVGYYTYNLIRALSENYPNNLRLVGHYFNFLGTKGHIDLPTGKNISYVQSKIVPGKVLSATRRLGFQLPLEVFFKRRGDLALYTNFVSLPSVTGIPTVVAVHDLCYEDVPQYVAEKNRKFLHRFVPTSIKRAAKVITISEETKKAIKKHYGVSDRKLVITPIPPASEHTDHAKDLKSLGIKGSFILFLSTLEPRKNLLNLVKAYEQLKPELREQYSLVIAGGKGWYIEKSLAYIKDLQDQGVPIILTGYVSNDERIALYNEASLFVMPSHYEGFGMPLLEAMSYGVASAVSDIAVFHEAAGDSVAYFDKDNPADIARVLAELLSSKAKRQKFVELGSQRLKLFNWSKVANEVMQTFTEISAKK